MMNQLKDLPYKRHKCKCALCGDLVSMYHLVSGVSYPASFSKLLGRILENPKAYKPNVTIYTSYGKAQIEFTMCYVCIVAYSLMPEMLFKKVEEIFVNTPEAE